MGLTLWLLRTHQRLWASHCTCLGALRFCCFPECELWVCAGEGEKTQERATLGGGAAIEETLGCGIACDPEQGGGRRGSQETKAASTWNDACPLLSPQSDILKEGASEEEIRLSKMVMKFWANFARNGNPNGEGLPRWPEYNQEEGYLQIGANTQAAQKLKDKEVAFWTTLFAKKAVEKPPQTEHIEL
ncbi:uncharacterized protein [Macaca nemestrina]|uniref:uncharacterized protein isoform X1 n=1 Tax=Macaca nemestrina TaxID=9545 RepID=UPI0039B9322F